MIVDKGLREFVTAIVDKEENRRQIFTRERLVDDLLHGDAAERGLR